jgi:hypothetical protein
LTRSLNIASSRFLVFKSIFNSFYHPNFNLTPIFKCFHLILICWLIQYCFKCHCSPYFKTNVWFDLILKSHQNQCEKSLHLMLTDALQVFNCIVVYKRKKKNNRIASVGNFKFPLINASKRRRVNLETA